MEQEREQDREVAQEEGGGVQEVVREEEVGGGRQFAGGAFGQEGAGVLDDAESEAFLRFQETGIVEGEEGPREEAVGAAAVAAKRPQAKAALKAKAQDVLDVQETLKAKDSARDGDLRAKLPFLSAELKVGRTGKATLVVSDGTRERRFAIPTDKHVRSLEWPAGALTITLDLSTGIFSTKKRDAKKGIGSFEGLKVAKFGDTPIEADRLAELGIAEVKAAPKMGAAPFMGKLAKQRNPFSARMGGSSTMGKTGQTMGRGG